MSSTIDQVFELAAAEVQSELSDVSHDDLAYLYGHYKQAKMGDNHTSEPWFVDIKGQRKWQAWTACKGLTCSEAMQAYCRKANALLLDKNGVSKIDAFRALFFI